MLKFVYLYLSAKQGSFCTAGEEMSMMRLTGSMPISSPDHSCLLMGGITPHKHIILNNFFGDLVFVCQIFLLSFLAIGCHLLYCH